MLRSLVGSEMCIRDSLKIRMSDNNVSLLDMSLDEVAKNQGGGRSFGGRGGGRGGRGGRRGGRRDRGTGPIRRERNTRFRSNSAPYNDFGQNKNGADDDVWKHDKFDETVDTRRNASNNFSLSSSRPTTVRITNLHYEAFEKDLEGIFKKYGPQSIKIYYDKAGRSKGKADIVFNTSKDADTAVEEMNGVNIEHQPMELKIVKTQQGFGDRQQRNPRRVLVGGGRNRRGGGNNRSGSNLKVRVSF
eukprot:TRINITY_DN1008_c0_g1_i1.p1 TRINITY_DN1008_c0_g1~~TRINITY_DN1008_c0_g1_i1.p1  ORF type:complete len:245 (-),score=47.00 TRINITY_DN1008_c0_g1_i1:144-878(-)